MRICCARCNAKLKLKLPRRAPGRSGPNRKVCRLGSRIVGYDIRWAVGQSLLWLDSREDGESNTLTQNAQDFWYVSHDVIVTQVNGNDSADEFEKLPNLTGRYCAINGFDRSVFAFIEYLCCNHFGNALPQSSFD